MTADSCCKGLKRILAGFLLLAFLFGASTVIAADVFYWTGYDRSQPRMGPDGTWMPGDLIIDGEITPGDFDKIVAVLKNHSIPRVSIDSPGGNVVEALKIGRLFRDALMPVLVSKKSECASACFLILVGGSERLVNAPIGIHRAYFDEDYFRSLSPIEAERQYRRLDGFVREYLYEMYVPEDVVAEMLATKSTSASYLSPDEFRNRVGYVTPALEEWRIAKCGDEPDGRDSQLTEEKFRELFMENVYCVATAENEHRMAFLRSLRNGD